MKVFIEPCFERPKIMVIYIDEEPWHEFDSSFFPKHFSFPEHLSTIEDLEEFYFRTEFQSGNRLIIAKLAVRNYYSGELKKLLKEKGVSDKTIARIIKNCKEDGYLDDEAWIAGFVNRERRNKNGPALTRLKLKRIGIPEHLIENALAPVQEDEVQEEGVRKILQTKYSSRNLKDIKEKNKVVAGLMRKGFDFDIVIEIVNSL